jgi:hypothetical protein
MLDEIAGDAAARAIMENAQTAKTEPLSTLSCPWSSDDRGSSTFKPLVEPAAV